MGGGETMDKLPPPLHLAPQTKSLKVDHRTKCKASRGKQAFSTHLGPAEMSQRAASINKNPDKMDLVSRRYEGTQQVKGRMGDTTCRACGHDKRCASRGKREFQ